MAGFFRASGKSGAGKANFFRRVFLGDFGHLRIRVILEQKFFKIFVHSNGYFLGTPKTAARGTRSFGPGRSKPLTWRFFWLRSLRSLAEKFLLKRKNFSGFVLDSKPDFSGPAKCGSGRRELRSRRTRWRLRLLLRSYSGVVFEGSGKIPQKLRHNGQSALRVD